MSKTINAHFDGNVIIPEKPVKLPVGKRLRIVIELEPTANVKKNGKPLKITGQGQFESGIPDLGSNKKHLEGFGKK
jgi:predicted DNA-binding antitoxin AbrB/MazE fold protein